MPQCERKLLMGLAVDAGGRDRYSQQYPCLCSLGGFNCLLLCHWGGLPSIHPDL